MTGYPEKDLVSSPFTEFIHPDDQPAVAELYLQSLKGEEVPQGSIVRSIGKEGKVIWFGLKAVSFTWDEKPAVWLLMNDITERKMAEDSLRESEKRYRLLAENVSDVIWVNDMNMRHTYLSPSTTRLLGYSMEEAMARGMQESLTPASLKAAADAVLSAMDAERKGRKDAMSRIPALELEMVRKDGSIAWVSSTFSFIRGPDGQPVEMMGV
jgi:PAS domain S-box-containing protein